MGALVLDFLLKNLFYLKKIYFIILIVFVIDFLENHFVKKTFLTPKRKVNPNSFSRKKKI
jgi:hypothetical protein